MKYKVMIIDLDNTLLDFDAMELGSLKASLKRFGIDPIKEIVEDYIEINHGLWSGLEKGTYTKEAILSLRFETLFDKHGIDVNPSDMNDLYLKSMADHLNMFPGAYEILSYYKDKCLMVCMTNGVQSAQEAKFEKAGLYQYFDHIIISDLVGYHKPDVRIFEFMSNLIGDYKKSEMVIIGDSISSDIRGGNVFGIDTVWFNPKQMENTTSEPVTYEIKSLVELFTII